MQDQSQDPDLPVQKLMLVMKPWVDGTANAARVVVRLRDEPRYLVLRRQEHEALAALSLFPVTVEAFLGRHFGGHGGMTFQEAVGFLEQLVNQEAIVGLTPSAKRALLAFTRRPRLEMSGLTLAYQRLWHALDIPLLHFSDCVWDKRLARLGSWLMAPVGLGLQGVALVLLALLSPSELASHRALALALVREPDVLFLKALLAFSVAFSVTNLLQLIVLLGAGVRFVGGSLRLTALVLLNFAVDDSDVRMRPRSVILRYRGQVLLMPFVLAFLCATLPAGRDEVSFTHVLSFAFFLLGAFHLCPLVRGQLVKLGEAMTVTDDLIERSNAFLARGLFRGLVKAKVPAAMDEVSSEAWLVAFASLSLVWLYGTSSFFAALFIEQIPTLIDKWFALGQETSRNGWHSHLLFGPLASLFLMALIAVAALLPALRFFFILGENIYAVARLPLQKVRAGLAVNQGQAIPPDMAVSAFLKTIPVLQHLSEATLAKLGTYLRFKRYPRRAAIITQGEEGNTFYVLAQGEAHVIVESHEGVRRVVDVLKPGDSFGEVALIEKVRRTASILAKTPVLALILDRRQFNAVFPEGSVERTSLTKNIRLAKLVADAKAFSHFTPAEIRMLLREAEMVFFAQGEKFIEEGATADHAYLIESGFARVMREKSGSLIAVLGRGELVGTIALVKDMTRTASVVAETDVTCLRIRKETFHRMCLMNPLVAMLVVDEADRQLGELEAS